MLHKIAALVLLGSVSSSCSAGEASEPEYPCTVARAGNTDILITKHPLDVLSNFQDPLSIDKPLEDRELMTTDGDVVRFKARTKDGLKSFMVTFYPALAKLHSEEYRCGPKVLRPAYVEVDGKDVPEVDELILYAAGLSEGSRLLVKPYRLFDRR